MVLSNQQLAERLRRTGTGAPRRENPSYVGNVGFGGFEDANQDGPTTAGLYASSSTSTAQTNPANIAADIMSKDSRLMQAAETRGLQSANRRGLVNSSMAVGASQDAVLDQVVPLASQEAQQRFQDNSDQRNFGFESLLSRQDYEQTGGLAADQFAYERDLERMRIDAARDASALDRDFELTFQDREIGSRFELAEMDADIRRELMTMESDMRDRILRAEQALESKNISTEAYLTARNQHDQRINNIMNNPDLSAEDRVEAIQAENDKLYADVQLIEDMYSIDLSWTEDYQPEVDTTQQAENTRRRIEDFYQDILGREGDRTGVNFYEGEVTSGRMTLGEVRAQIVQSREGSSASDNDRQQQSFTGDVRNAYRDVLGRLPDEQGAAFWSDQLRRGNVTIADVRRSLQESDEGQGRVRYDAQTGQLVPVQGNPGAQTGTPSQGLDQSGGQQQNPASLTDDLRRAYRDELGRDADSAGFNFWMNQLQSGRVNMQDVRRALSQSDEGQGKVRYDARTGKLVPINQGSSSTTQPTKTQTPQKNPVSLMNSGPRPLTDQEARTAQGELKRVYYDALGRLPDSAGFNFWMGQLRKGNVSLKDVRAALKASDEGQGKVRYNPQTKRLEPVK